MPCFWQLYEPLYFVFSLHLHPHITSVHCAESAEQGQSWLKATLQLSLLLQS